MFKWQQLARRKRGRPLRSWNAGTRKVIAERRLNENVTQKILVRK